VEEEELSEGGVESEIELLFEEISERVKNPVRNTDNNECARVFKTWCSLVMSGSWRGQSIQ
jgi:hypothetical protein